VESMAIKLTSQKEKIPGNKVSEIPPDRPVLDLSDAAVKALVRTAKKRGYVTHDQINALLASEEVNSEQIESILAKFSEIGINVVETKEARLEEEVEIREEPEEEKEENEGENQSVEIQQRSALAKAGAKEPAERSDDLCACTSAKWARWNSFRAKVRLQSPSVSRPAAKQ
jgi:RNA polymerase primary sigma factor